MLNMQTIERIKIICDKMLLLHNHLYLVKENDYFSSGYTVELLDEGYTDMTSEIHSVLNKNLSGIFEREIQELEKHLQNLIKSENVKSK